MACGTVFGWDSTVKQLASRQRGGTCGWRSGEAYGGLLPSQGAHSRADHWPPAPGRQGGSPCESLWSHPQAPPTGKVEAHCGSLPSEGAEREQWGRQGALLSNMHPLMRPLLLCYSSIDIPSRQKWTLPVPIALCLSTLRDRPPAPGDEVEWCPVRGYSIPVWPGQSRFSIE